MTNDNPYIRALAERARIEVLECRELPEDQKVPDGAPYIVFGIITNPLQPDHVDLYARQHFEGKTLAEYIGDLSGDWVIAFRDRIVELHELPDLVPEAGEAVIICPVPRGGDAFKMVLMIAALIVLTIVTFGSATLGIAGIAGGGALGFAGGSLGAYMVASAVYIGGAMLINALLGPKPPKVEGWDASKSYGYDGPKNTATNNIPVPIVSGPYRVAGNIIALYTELGIKSLGGYEATETTNWDNPVLFDFNSIRGDYGGEYSNTSGDQYLYMLINAGEGPIDGIADIEVNDQPVSNFQNVEWAWRDGSNNQAVIPAFNETKVDVTVNIECNVDGAWTVRQANIACDRLRVDLLFPAGLYRTQNSGGRDSTTVFVNIEIRKIGDSTWLKFSDLTAASGSQAEAYNITKNSTAAVRMNFYSPQLDDTAIYEVRIKRDNMPGDRKITNMTWVSVVQVTDSPIRFNYTALLALRIRMNEQLYGIPKVTFLHKGQKFQVYDETTQQFVTQKTDNPAWLVYNFFTNTRWGAGLPASRMDLYAFRSWAQDCTTLNLKWRGPIEQQGSLWDTINPILRVGRAQVIRMGTKYTVSVEKVKPSVMLFSNANIKEKTFQQSWMNLDDRANEMEVDYFDSTDGYKQKTTKIVDQASQTLYQKPIATKATYYGVDNLAQAEIMAQFELNHNALIETVTFETGIEALSCQIGDRVTVQHDMTAWGEAGRLPSAGTTTAITLDRPVTMVIGRNYEFLVSYDQLTRFTNTVSSKVGNFVYITGLDWATITEDVDVLKIGSAEYPIKRKIVVTGNHDGVEVEDATSISVGNTVQIIDCDALVRRPVVFQAGQVSSITLSSALPASPEQYTKWMFGEINENTKDFTVRDIKIDADFNISLGLLEYNEAIFNVVPGTTTPPDTYGGPGYAYPLDPCTLVSIKQGFAHGLGKDQWEVLVEWRHDNQAYKDALVYSSVNGAAFIPQGYHLTSYRMTAFTADVLQFIVVPRSLANIEATLAAQTVWSYTVLATGGGGTISNEMPTPSAPTGLYGTAAVTTNQLFWSPPTTDEASFIDHAEIHYNITNNSGTATRVGISSVGTFVHSVPPMSNLYYWVRFVNKNGVVGPFSASVNLISPKATDPFLDLLESSLTESQLYGDLNTRINLIDTPTSGLWDRMGAMELVVNDPTTGLSATVAAVNQLEVDINTDTGLIGGKYTLKIDANGYVAGFGFAVTANAYNPGVGHSEALFSVDTFGIASPGATSLSFLVQSGIVVMDAAHIQDATITNAKIGNTIQSNDWNATTHQGWRIQKDGSIEARKITIYDNNGNVLLQSGASLSLGNQIANSAITINSNGTLSGAGAGQVTITGLGYSGDLAATKNTITTSSSNPTGGADGDLHYNSSTDTWWTRINGTWTMTATIGADGHTIYNADFEFGDKGWTKGSGWNISEYGFAHQGTWSARNSAVGGSSYQLQSRTFHPCSEGDQFLFGGYVLTSDGVSPGAFATAGWRLQWYQGDKTTIITNVSATTSTVSTSWQYVRSIAAAPAGAQFARLVAVVTGKTGGNVYVDEGFAERLPKADEINNAVITINANGALQGAGGGQVTIGGLGYTGALDATKNVITASALDPSGGNNGDMHYNTASLVWWVKENGAWRVAGSYGAPAGTLVGGTSASTVEANAANGNTAFSGTTLYRTAGAPTNNPTPSSITVSTNTNGTVNIQVGWGAYTQGARQADFLMLFWRKDGTAPGVNDSAIAFNVNTSASSYYVFEGVNPADTFSFGIAAARRTESGLEIGTIQAPTTAPDWIGVTNGTPNYTANVNGVAATTITTVATNFNNRNDRIATAVVAPTVANNTASIDHTLNNDGTANISFEWAWGGAEADIDGFIIYVHDNDTTTPVAQKVITSAADATVTTYFAPASARAFILNTVSADHWYTFAVQAYRYVDADINASQVLKSTIAQIASGNTETTFGAYRPSSNVAFAGNITGTVNGTAASAISTAVTNFNNRNDRIATAVVAPTVANNTASIDHTINADGSADVSFEWAWGGAEADIDGFIVYVHDNGTTTPVAQKTISGSADATVQAFYVPASRRAAIFSGIAANHWYTFGVQAYRTVDADINASQILTSTVAQIASGNSECTFGAYRPSSNVAFTGDITGTINGTAASVVSTAVSNFNAANDRNTTAITAPTCASDGSAVDHTANANGSVNISFEWSWGGTEGDIDGFMVYVYQTSASGAYTWGTSPALETVYQVPANKRAFVLFGVQPTDRYHFAVRAYRKIDTSLGGIIQTALVQPGGSDENPYRPSTTTAFQGDITGTLNGSLNTSEVNVWTYISGTGRPEDYATLGAGNAGDVNSFNTNFEFGDIGWSKGTSWTIGTPALGSAHQGTQVGQHAPTTSGTHVLRNQTLVPCTEGDQFLGGGYVRIASGAVFTEGGWTIDWLQSDGTTIISRDKAVVTSHTGDVWVPVRVLAAAPANAQFARLSGWAWGHTSGGNIYVDDGFLARLPKADEINNESVLQNAITALNQNPYFEVRRPDNRPAGWFSPNNSLPSWVDSTNSWAQMVAGTALLSAAFPVTPNSRYNVKVRCRTGAGVATDDLTIAVNELNADLGDGKIALGHQNGTSDLEVQIRSSAVTISDSTTQNLPASPTWTTFSFTYIPTAGTKWASISLSLVGTGPLQVDYCAVSNDATYGADWGSNVVGIPYDQIYNNDDLVAMGLSPTFQGWTGAYPPGYQNFAGSAPTQETSIVRVGSYAVKYVSAGGANLGMMTTNTEGRTTWSTTPMPVGTFIAGAVDVYLQARTSGLPGLLIRLFTDASLTGAQSVDTLVQPPSTTTGMWQRVPFTARVGTAQQIYGIRIYVMGSYGSFASGHFTGTAIFDNMRVAFFDTTTDNKVITIDPNGTLNGAGGGQVTLGGMGFDLAGIGTNIMSPRYSDFHEAALPPVTLVNATAALASVGSVPRNCLALTVTTQPGLVWLGSSATDYNIRLHPNRKWLVSVYMRSGVASGDYTIYLKTGDGTQYSATGSGLALNTWQRVTHAFDLSASAQITAILGIEFNEAASSVLRFTDVMIEAQYLNSTVAAPYSAPSWFTIDTNNVGTIITNAAIGTAHIANAAITSAKILDANITTAKIADLNVSTLKVADNAITIGAVTTNADVNFQKTTGTDGYNTVSAAYCSTTHNLGSSAGASQKILIAFTFSLYTGNNNAEPFQVWLYKDGSQVSGSSRQGYAQGNTDLFKQTWTFVWVVDGDTSSHTWDVRFQKYLVNTQIIYLTNMVLNVDGNKK